MTGIAQVANVGLSDGVQPDVVPAAAAGRRADGGVARAGPRSFPVVGAGAIRHAFEAGT